MRTMFTRLLPLSFAVTMLLSIGVALAQDQPAPSGRLVCDESGGACNWVVSPQAQTVSVPSYSSSEPVLDSEPTRYLLAWQDSPPSLPLRTRKAPAPQCAETIDELKGRLQVGVEYSHINLALSAYDWAGQSSESAEVLVERFMSFTPGKWQERVVQGRLGSSANDSNPRGTRLRFLSLSGELQGEFVTVQNMGCWFLRFTSVSRNIEEAQESHSTEEEANPTSNLIYIDPAPGSDLDPIEIRN